VQQARSLARCGGEKEEWSRAQQLDQGPQERSVARAEQQDDPAELAKQAALRPRRPGNRRRTITLVVMAVGFLLAGLLSLLTLLPTATSSSGGVPVGTAAPELTLPIYGVEEAV
jgi:hypothetical protein